MGELPANLFEHRSLDEIAGVLGRWLVIKELRMPISERYKELIARGEVYERNRKGDKIAMNFERSLKRAWIGYYEDLNGFDMADVETAAMMLGVYDDVFAYRPDFREAA